MWGNAQKLISTAFRYINSKIRS